MNVPPPQPAPSVGAPDNSTPAPEIGSAESEIGSDISTDWGSESSNEDSDEGEVDSLYDDPCADEAYWEEEAAIDAYMARLQTETSNLYPQLYVIKPIRGKVQTPPLSDINSLLHLPPEIRNRIYTHYFDRDEEVKHPEDNYAPFRDCEGIEMQRICISSENVDLKFWLSTALLQTSRQLRFEAMFILFKNSVITVEWLPALPQLVEFLGKEVCSMVRYLDVWDTLNVQEFDNDGYQDILANIMHFSNLQHLRIVVSGGLGGPGFWGHRISSWFDQNEWKHDGTLTGQAIPKIRSENTEDIWPEYELLKKLKAQKFTFAMEAPCKACVGGYLEFDVSHGAYPSISKSIQDHVTPAKSTLSPTNLAASISPQVLEDFEALEVQPRSIVLTPSTDLDDEDFDSPTWQENDNLANKTIPIYNFLRLFFHNKVPSKRVQGEISAHDFVTFPTAKRSAGSIIQGCPFCYLTERHCGYHAVPDQPPFQPKPLEDDPEEEVVNVLEAQFVDLSYVDMRKVCRDVVRWIVNTGISGDMRPSWDEDATEFGKIVALFDYVGWPEQKNGECLAGLDAAATAGWSGHKVDKGEVPPWDLLYREVYSRYKVGRTSLRL